MGPFPTIPPAPTTEATSSAEGKGHGKAGGQGRGRGSGRAGNRQSQGPAGGTNPNFKGHTAELGGHVFQVFHESNNRNQFTRTIEALGKYFTKNMKYAGDIMPLARDLKTPEVVEPSAIAKAETDRQVIFKWEKEMTDYITRKNVLESNLKAAYTIMWGQCSEALRAKVKSSATSRQHTP